MNTKTILITVHKLSRPENGAEIIDVFKVIHKNTPLALDETRPCAIRKHPEFILQAVFFFILLAIVASD